MEYTLIDLYDGTVDAEEYTLVNLYDGSIEIGVDSVQLSSPANGATAVTTTPTLQWVDFPNASRYIVRVWDYTGDVKGDEIIEAYPSESEYTIPTALQNSTKYLWQVTVATLSNEANPIPDEITGISISSGTTIEQGGSRIFTIGTTGTGNYDTSYTASGAGFTFSISGDQLTVTETGGNVDDTKSFTVTSVEDNAITDSRTLTVVEASAYTPVDTIQGDFEALQALYDATQGQNVPTLNSTDELPQTLDRIETSAGQTEVEALDATYPSATLNDHALVDNTNFWQYNGSTWIEKGPRLTSCISYPYMYKIGTDIYYAEYERLSEFYEGNDRKALSWVNKGAPWTVKTGWDTMTAQTMGDAVGVTTNANGRVTRIDLQKINTVLTSGVYLTTGNTVVGELPVEIGNLQQLEYWNVKQNLLYGEIPSSVSNWGACVKQSWSGGCWDIPYEDRRQWHESDHRKGFPEISIIDGLAVGSGRLTDLSKKIMATNRFRTDLPNVDGLQSLELLEIRHQFLTGSVPAYSNLPSIKGIFIDNQRYSDSATISGSIPSSWGNFTGVIAFQIGNYHTSRKLSGYIPSTMDDNWSNLSNVDLSSQLFSGPIPTFVSSRDKYYVNIDDNNFGLDLNGNQLSVNNGGGFPSEYFNGDNSELTKWQISKCSLTGELPTTITAPNFPRERTNYAVDAPGIGDNNWSGSVPDWFQTFLGMQTFFIANIGFSGSFPDKVMEQNNLKTFYIHQNNFTGPLPDKSWGTRRIGWHYGYLNGFTGSIPERWRSLALVDNDLYDWDVSRLKTPNIRYQTSIGTSGTLTWDAVADAVYYEVDVKDSNDDTIYSESGITSTSLEVSGLSVAPSSFIVNGVYWSGSNEFTGTGASLTWDAVTGADGYQVEIFNASNELVLREGWMVNESLTVSGLTSADYYWRVRGMSWINDMRFAWQNNNLSGEIPSWLGEFSSGSVNLSNNRFSFKDIGPTYSAIKAAHGDSYRVSNQKPFGENQNETVATGGNVSLDLSEFDYTNNSYQWLKAGQPISNGGQYSGATTHTLTITGASSGDAGEYTLQVTNSDLSELGTQVSRPILLQVT